MRCGAPTRGLVLAALLTAAGAASAIGGAAPTEPDCTEDGRRLLDGRTGLKARIAGQDFHLPTQASRCGNCHGSTPAAAATPTNSSLSIGPAGPAVRPAPVLDAALFRNRQARRGGPPSSYDSVSFCRLLRTGIDPASVMVGREMPRFDISAEDCASLWACLGARK